LAEADRTRERTTGSRKGKGARSAWLTPILVDYASRDGSTLMMRLLHSSPQVVVEPPYPYEHKYFAYLVRWSRLLDRPDWPGDQWSGSDLASLAQERNAALLGPPPWFPRAGFEPGAREEPMSKRCFRFVWRQFSRRAALAAADGSLHGAQKVVYYAEKHLKTWLIDLEELPPLRVIVLLRDPRDVFVSIRAFNASRDPGAPLIGQLPGEVEESWRDRYLRQQRERLRWIAGLGEDDEWPVIRYEDLVRDLAGEARRLERALSIQLDPESVLSDEELRNRHATSASGEVSVGRWREELSRREAKLFERALADELAALGFSA
jgi:hypothetical protein